MPIAATPSATRCVTRYGTSIASGNSPITAPINGVSFCQKLLDATAARFFRAGSVPQRSNRINQRRHHDAHNRGGILPVAALFPKNPFFGLAKRHTEASFGLRFSFFWQADGAPVPSQKPLTRGNIGRKTNLQHNPKPNTPHEYRPRGTHQPRTERPDRLQIPRIPRRVDRQGHDSRNPPPSRSRGRRLQIRRSHPVQ